MFLVWKKKNIIAVFLIVAVVIATIGCTVYGIQTVSANAKERLLPVYGVSTEENICAISFDAAWGADKTEKILDILDEFEVKTTFFLVGFWIDKYPEMVKEIADRGHLIGNHSASHPHFNTLSRSAMAMEIELAATKITAITGQEVKFFRAPFGEYNNTLIDVLASRGDKCIQWTVDSLDWKGTSASEMTNKVVSKTQKGGIVLFHNNSDHIVEALPQILKGLKEKGLKCVRMDEIVIQENYYIDNNGIQHRN